MSFKTLLIISMLFLMVGSANADSGREVVVTALSGTVEYQKTGRGGWLPLAKGEELHQYDVIRTAGESTCTLLFKGMSDASVEMRPKSKLELSTVADTLSGDDTRLELSIGSVLIKAESLRGDSSFEVKTPNSIVGIRGTEFEVSVD